jgi:hypothetical protein
MGRRRLISFESTSDVKWVKDKEVKLWDKALGFGSSVRLLEVG